MPTIRTTMFFSFGPFGWSETYCRLGDIDANMESAALALASARRVILAENVDLTHLRLSDVDVKRDSRLLEVASASTKGNNVNETDVPHTCILARADGSTLYRKSIYLRGVPDYAINSRLAGKMQIDPPFQNDVEKFLAHLKTKGWGFIVRDKFPVDPSNIALLRYGKITTVDNITATPIITVETQVAHNLSDNSQVLISGVKGPRSVNGLHPIEVSVALGVKVFRLRDFGGLNGKVDNRFYTGGGVFRAYQPKFVPITGFDVIKIGHRDTGRPFFSPVGRRRTQRS